MESIRKTLRSFSYAIRGLKYVVKNEQNFQFEIVGAFFVIALMVIFDITGAEKVALFIVIFAVLIMELLNTIFERVVDILKPRVHPYARLIKDMMAAAVLLASLGAVVIGVIIFYPHVLALL